jgi:predicted glycosyltransferase
VRSVPSLAAELVNARASISQCGYNTALDLLRTRVPALVVPFAAPGEDEQTLRAALLERLGAVRVADEASLDAEAVRALIGTTPTFPSLRLDGAARSCAILAELVADRQRGAA